MGAIFRCGRRRCIGWRATTASRAKFVEYATRTPVAAGPRHASLGAPRWKARQFTFRTCWPIRNTRRRRSEALPAYQHDASACRSCAKGRPIGVIALYRAGGAAHSPTSRSSWSTTFADQAVIAIENARLLNELRQRTDELGRSVDELRALGEVSQAVNSTLDLETVLSTIVAKAVQLSGTEAGAIYVFDDRATRISSARHLRHGSGVD